MCLCEKKQNETAKRGDAYTVFQLRGRYFFCFSPISLLAILPVVTKDLPISPRFTPYDFLSRCKVGILTTRQPTVELSLLTFSRFTLRKKEHKSCFDKNRTHDFRNTSRLPTRPLRRRLPIVNAVTRRRFGREEKTCVVESAVLCVLSLNS